MKIRNQNQLELPRLTVLEALTSLSVSIMADDTVEGQNCRSKKDTSRNIKFLQYRSDNQGHIWET